MTTEYLGSTVGLECNHQHGGIGKLVKVLYERRGEQRVALQAVSGRTLANAGKPIIIDRNEFDARPRDPYNSIAEARWALNRCGWTLMYDDAVGAAD